MALDRRIPCTRECPERSPTCKATCEKWAAWESIKREEYAKRKMIHEAYPVGPAKATNAKRKAMSTSTGRKR